ncbi:MAG TPA: ribosomal RNA small subunit methyltransferase A [Nitrospirae bacterium]|nr:ribosomal RNA small subunit methyltransferase A [Nitrospirota bacterium]HDK16819.1 ribosomal RNA small subunit methyltransferase A [Nitrospirota bacterium]HDK81769.1 ribosomal RNA small subunit methyltransferase A [Nitrospirota bacterium]HDO25892.1 ribosomal RNA small subunit methyltransferase A [Nitrospirota bacterium]
MFRCGENPLYRYSYMHQKLGQHFLFDKNILRKIVNCSGVISGDSVIEIGPGLGTLTALLAGRAKRVLAIEIDRKLVQKLNEVLLPIKNVSVINADALKFPFDTVKGKFKVVANIPYYITTPILFRLLEFRKKITSMTLLMQKEVARRIVAAPGGRDYGVLSIGIQVYTKPKIKFTVSKRAFSPPPKVDSAVVYFDVPAQPVHRIKDEAFFHEVVKTAFSQRRKTLLNSLRSLEEKFPGSLKGIKESLLEAGIDPGLRPEVLGIEDFARLAQALRK